MPAEAVVEYEERKFKMVVYRISETEFSVLSLNSTFGRPKQYVVKWIGYKWICSCPDYAKHSEEIDYACKHIEAMFKAVKKIGWSRDGIEVEVVRRYRQNGMNGGKVAAEVEEKVLFRLEVSI
jgi:predicted nucleic acid-binding Zn finger protein